MGHCGKPDSLNSPQLMGQTNFCAVVDVVPFVDAWCIMLMHCVVCSVYYLLWSLHYVRGCRRSHCRHPRRRLRRRRCR